jgi:hypothetical protein
MSALRGAAAWTGPVLLGVVTTRVAAGAPDAPLLVLAAIVAPLVALLQPRAPERPHPVSAAAVVISAALVLTASVLPLGDAALLLGGRRWYGIVLATAVLLLLTLSPRGHGWRLAALAAGGSVLVLCLVLLAVATGLTPWSAWRDAAARPALLFSAHSPWVTDSGWFARRTTLAFEEGHRLVVTAPGTFRVVEQEGTGHVVREWRLQAGDALSLRPGDRLIVEAGSRLRFEAGKRVPGAAPSGAAWAESGSAPLVGSLAALATLMLGAIGLIPAAGRRELVAPAALLVLGLAAACWGIYAVAAVPETMLSGSVVEPLLRLPSALPGARVLTPLVALALLAFFLAAAGALRERVTTLAGERGTAVWGGVVIAAAVASFWPFDPWLVLMIGLGFAAATLAAPRLAGSGSARIKGWPLEALGAVAGAAVFVAVVALEPRLPVALAALAQSPVLVAAPAGFLAVKLLR